MFASLSLDIRPHHFFCLGKNIRTYTIREVQLTGQNVVAMATHLGWLLTFTEYYNLDRLLNLGWLLTLVSCSLWLAAHFDCLLTLASCQHWLTALLSWLLTLTGDHDADKYQPHEGHFSPGRVMTSASYLLLEMASQRHFLGEMTSPSHLLGNMTSACHLLGEMTWQLVGHLRTDRRVK